MAVARNPFHGSFQAIQYTNSIAQNKIFYGKCVLTCTDKCIQCSYNDILLFSHQYICGSSTERTVIFKEKATNMTERSLPALTLEA